MENIFKFLNRKEEPMLRGYVQNKSNEDGDGSDSVEDGDPKFNLK